MISLYLAYTQYGEEVIGIFSSEDVAKIVVEAKCGAWQKDHEHHEHFCGIIAYTLDKIGDQYIKKAIPEKS